MARTTFIVCSFLSCLVLLTAAPAEDKCAKDVPDKCLNEVLFIGNPDVPVPENDQLLDDFCTNYKSKTENCILDYIKGCMKSFARQVATILANSVIKEVESWCGEDRDLLVYNGPCLASIKPQLDSCMQDFVNVLFAISQHDDEDNMIPFACCEFGSFRQCAIDATSTSCEDETLEFVERVITSYSSELLDVACANYKHGSSECDALPHVDWTSTTPRNVSQYKTPLPALLDLVQRL